MSCCSSPVSFCSSSTPRLKAQNPNDRVNEVSLHYIFTQSSMLFSLSESVKAESTQIGLTAPDEPHLALHLHPMPVGPGPQFQVIMQPSTSAIQMLVSSSAIAPPLSGYGSCRSWLTHRLSSVLYHDWAQQ